MRPVRAALACLVVGCAMPSDDVSDVETQTQALSTWRRTVVFIQGETRPGQDMFVRGGIDHGYAAEVLGRTCTAQNGLCALPIRHRNRLNAAGFKFGDTQLDWYGAEPTQVATGAEGTPLDWTTNSWPAGWGPAKYVATDGYGVTSLNTAGPHYWMLDVEMDCARTVDGWFEVKSFISNGPGWEPNVAQADAPYASGNHFARCGEVNVFRRGDASAAHRPFDTGERNTWVGNATALISRGASGNDCATSYEAPFALGEQPIVFDSWVYQRAVARNVCFDVYVQGVTEPGDASVLDRMDVKVAIRYAGQQAFTPVPVSYAGDAGNNVRLRMNLNDAYPFSPYDCPTVPHVYDTAPYPTLSTSAEFYVEVNGREYRPATSTGTYRVDFTEAIVPYQYETRCTAQ